MILKNKNVVIYGAAGSIGSTVAKALAHAGAAVFLTGRNLDSVQKVANDILSSGGTAETSQVNAMDEKAIKHHIDSVVQKAGTIDIVFNAIGLEVVQNIPLTDISVADFVRPVSFAMQTQFLTATIAGKIMMKQRSGVILSLTATPGGIGYPLTGGFAPACCAMEGLSRNLASELGIYNIRVVNMRSGGSPDSKVFKDAFDNNPEEMTPILRKMEADTALKRLPSMADIANVAVFLASDLAGGITGVTIDVTCGTTAALNHRTSSPV